MQALRKTVGDITGRFGGAYSARRAEAREPCGELWMALGDAGFIGINVPEEYGGGGAGLRELAAVCEETAAAGAPLLLLLVSQAISAGVIGRYGCEGQKTRWLPGLASGRSKVVFAITEPDAGSNTHELSTVAVRDGEDWLLSGTKYYISGVDEADAVLVVARTGAQRGRDPGTNKPRLSLFVVPVDTPGPGGRARRPRGPGHP